jgi:hypothetical protein
MKKAWCGPVNVFCQRGRDVFVWANGDFMKIESCRVQPYKVGIEEEQDMKDKIPKEEKKMKEKLSDHNETVGSKDEIKNK